MRNFILAIGIICLSGCTDHRLIKALEDNTEVTKELTKEFQLWLN